MHTINQLESLVCINVFRTKHMIYKIIYTIPFVTDLSYQLSTKGNAILECLINTNSNFAMP